MTRRSAHLSVLIDCPVTNLPSRRARFLAQQKKLRQSADYVSAPPPRRLAFHYRTSVHYLRLLRPPPTASTLPTPPASFPRFAAPKPTYHYRKRASSAGCRTAARLLRIPRTLRPQTGACHRTENAVFARRHVRKRCCSQDQHAAFTALSDDTDRPHAELRPQTCRILLSAHTTRHRPFLYRRAGQTRDLSVQSPSSPRGRVIVTPWET
jgi:hypothetical protein